jgi:hypothetical protein
MTRVATARVKSSIKVPWKLRLRYWWMRKRMSPESRRLMDMISEELDRKILFGEGGGNERDEE